MESILQNISNTLIEIQNNLISQDKWLIISSAGTISSSILALVLALKPTLVNWLGKAKIKIFFGENIHLVISQDLTIRKIHLDLNQANISDKHAVINRIEVKILKDKQKVYRGVWSLFVEERFGNLAIAKSRPYPIYLKPKDNIYQKIQFFSTNDFNMSLQHDNVLVGQYRNVLP